MVLKIDVFPRSLTYWEGHVQYYQERPRGKSRRPTNSLMRCDIRINVLVTNICITYRSHITPSLNGLDIGLSLSLKVNHVNMMVELDSRYMISYSGFNTANRHLQYTSLRNLNNRPWIWPFKVIQCKMQFGVYFLLVSNSKYMHISQRLAEKFPSCDQLLFGQNFGRPTQTLTLRWLFCKIQWFPLE